MSEAKRGRAARTAFEQKVQVLEHAVLERRDPDPSSKLRTVDDVRKWRGPDGALGTWSSFTVAAPGGPNSDLRIRLDGVLPTIVALQSGEPAKRIEPKKPRRGKPVSQRQVEKERDRLAFQVEELIEELETARKVKVRLESRVEILERENAALREAQRKIKRLEPVS